MVHTEGATAEKKATEEAASGPKTYRTVKEGQEIMAVKVVRSRTLRRAQL